VIEAPRPPSANSNREPGARSTKTVGAAWRRSWERAIPFFAFPPEVRKIIYTTNAIESLHMRLRTIIKTRGHFPSDAVMKRLWLSLRNTGQDQVRAGAESISAFRVHAHYFTLLASPPFRRLYTRFARWTFRPR
jgi:transposase-like protein